MISFFLFYFLYVLIKKIFMKYYYRFIGTLRRIHRLLNVKKRSEIVWKELITLQIEENWYFGQFENEKYILTTFTDKENREQKFRYEITKNNLKFHSFILNSFDEDKTNDILVLASHLNELISFGKVSVSTKYNCVQFIYDGDLVNYMLFPGEIHSDLRSHYHLTIDCIWAFSNLIETNEDPVFVISELLRRKEDKEKTTD